MDYDLREHNLGGIIEEASRRFNLSFRPKSMKLRMLGSERLPPVRVDREEMVGIFMGILAKVAEYGGENGEVTVGSWEEGEKILVVVKAAVSDAKEPGLGIPRIRHEHMARKIEADDKLNSCRRTIRARGGDMWASIDPTSVSSLFLTLPVAGKTPCDEDDE